MPTYSLPHVEPHYQEAIRSLWDTISPVKRLYWRQRYNNWSLTQPEEARLGVLNYFGRVVLAAAQGIQEEISTES